MPAHAKRPSPPARMVELLAIEKRQLLELGGIPTESEFEAAWERCWQIMVTERAWPHATVERRGWRIAMRQAMKPEACKCFCGEQTGFARYVVALAEAMDRSQAADEIVLTGQLVA